MIGDVSVTQHVRLYQRETLYAPCENARLQSKQPWPGPCARASQKSRSNNKLDLLLNLSQEQDDPTNPRVVEPQPGLTAEIEIAINPRR